MTQQIAEDPTAVVLRAVKILFGRSDEAQSKDDIGYNGTDKNNHILNDFKDKESLSPKQAAYAYKIILKYKTQLAECGITLPDKNIINNIVEQQNNGTWVRPGTQKNVAPAEPEVPMLDIDDEFIYIKSPRNYISVTRALKEAFKEAIYDQGTELCGFKRTDKRAYPTWNADDSNRWRYPLTINAWKMITDAEYFPVNKCKLSEKAQKYHNELAELERLRYIQIAEANEAKEREVAELIDMLGPDGLKSEVMPGMRLFQHQQENVKLELEKRYFLVADDTGLGKTLSAAAAVAALYRKFHYRVIIITTKPSMIMWERTMSALQIKHEVYSWAKIPKADNTHPAEPFVVIADEAHKMQNLSSARTKQALSLTWHWNCKAFFALTGTPARNGRPINMMPLLMALRHPLVYDDWKPNYPIQWNKKEDTGKGSLLPFSIQQKIDWYQTHFCDKHLESFGGRGSHWNMNGVLNLEELNALIHWKDGRANHKDAIMVSRKKTDGIIKMPPMIRTMLPVEIDTDMEKWFNKEIVDQWEAFLKKVDNTVKERTEAFKLQLVKDFDLPSVEVFTNPVDLSYAVALRLADARELLDVYPVKERESIMTAQAIVQYTQYRRISALAKVPAVTEYALSVLDEDQKIVLFSSFPEVLRRIGDTLEENGYPCGYVIGDRKNTDIQNDVDDFQNPDGRVKVMLCSDAGSEAITLTAASIMIIIDYPWTPGDLTQKEARCYRYKGEGEESDVPVNIYWIQMPSELCEIDEKICSLLEEKLRDISALQYGDNSVTGFDIEKVAASESMRLMKKTYKNIKKK